jgi:hypothetical protein
VTTDQDLFLLIKSARTKKISTKHIRCKIPLMLVSFFNVGFKEMVVQASTGRGRQAAGRAIGTQQSCTVLWDVDAGAGRPSTGRAVAGGRALDAVRRATAALGPRALG